MTERTLGQATAVAFHSAGGTTEERWEAAGQAAAAAERAEYDRLTGGFDAQGRNLAAERADAGVLREQLAIATVALRDIKDCYGTGAFGHDTAHSALDEIGGVKPAAPPGEADALREQLDGLRDRIDSLARGLDMSARTTAPGKESEIEAGCASALRGLLRNDGESDGETRERLDLEGDEMRAIFRFRVERDEARTKLAELRSHAASLEEDLDDAGATIAEYREALSAMQVERDRLRTQAGRVRGLAAEWADTRGSDNERIQLRATVARAVLSALGDEP